MPVIDPCEKCDQCVMGYAENCTDQQNKQNIRKCTTCGFEFHEIPFRYQGKFYCRTCADKLREAKEPRKIIFEVDELPIGEPNWEQLVSEILMQGREQDFQKVWDNRPKELH